MPLFLLVSWILFYPAVVTRVLNLDHSLRYYFYLLGPGVYGAAYLAQRLRLKDEPSTKILAV